MIRVMIRTISTVDKQKCRSIYGLIFDLIETFSSNEEYVPDKVHVLESSTIRFLSFVYGSFAVSIASFEYLKIFLVVLPSRMLLCSN